MRFDPRPGIRLFTGIHEFWYRMTDGLVGGNFMGAPMLLLTTIGRKSGRRRTTPLVYLQDGDDVIVIASNGGADRDPEWWLNLRANPQAEIQLGARRHDVRAELTSAAHRQRLWDEITRRYPVYRQYERSTAREIPVVRLTAEASPSAERPRAAAARTVTAKPKRRATARPSSRKSRPRATGTRRRGKPPAAPPGDR